MRNAILKVWRGESTSLQWFLCPLLFPLSCIYRICLRARDYMYSTGFIKVSEVPVPVISVGNITLGGTGKTPVVEKISRKLMQAGFHPAIATRGYKRNRKGTFIVDVNKDLAEDVGDEAFMLSRKTGMPVVVGTNRADAITMGMESFRIDVALLDDGFQLKNLKKDVEILVVSGGKGKTNRNIFPLGPYREPSERIKDADMILVSKGELNGNLKHYTEGIPIFSFQYRPVYLYNLKHSLTGHYNFLKGKDILAFSGLGDNASFFNFLKELGAHVVCEMSYPDHYFYGRKDMERFSRCQDAEIIVTTEKDAVKIDPEAAPENLYYLTVEVEIEREEEMMQMIQKKLNAHIKR
ncbi:MAG: tetraacyldisaccharide 4'-kinase [Proteobacteria bacterium]|nr:tetraacyldisaccharide 4'-kinase [Pseudomonadota bacterium]